MRSSDPLQTLNTKGTKRHGQQISENSTKGKLLGPVEQQPLPKVDTVLEIGSPMQPS